MVNSIGSFPQMNVINTEANKPVNQNVVSSFQEKLTNSIAALEENQVATQNSVTNLLTTGEGNAHEVLIQVNKAESQVKTFAMVRDKFIENYQKIMSMQI